MRTRQPFSVHWNFEERFDRAMKSRLLSQHGERIRTYYQLSLATLVIVRENLCSHS